MLQTVEITIRVHLSNTGNNTADDFINELDYELKSQTAGFDIIETELVDSEILE